MWLLLSACSGSDGSESTDHQQTDGETSDCAGADTFSEGIGATTTSGATVEIVSAAPTPPDVGDNTWVLSVSDGSGPLPGLSPMVTPWMPLHGHGVVPPDYVGVDQGDGTYAVPTFDVIMPGLWEFTVDLAPGTDDGDAAVFRFCAEG